MSPSARSVAESTRAACTPRARDEAWWLERHRVQCAELQAGGERGEPVDLLFLGDSITEGWCDPEVAALWDAHYGARRAVNLGVSGDCTEHLLWRLRNGALAGPEPRLVVLLIGTNNTGHRQDPPAATARAVETLVVELLARLPRARLLLLAIFPRGARAGDPLRTLNDEVNRRLARFVQGLGPDARVRFLDLGASFLGPDGSLSTELMPDGLHPSPAGYRLWAEGMQPWIDRWVP